MTDLRLRYWLPIPPYPHLCSVVLYNEPLSFHLVSIMKINVFYSVSSGNKIIINKDIKFQSAILNPM